ncbi:hypothetical protein HHK36_024522 [Tetracentron sinense]|uniref:Homeobox domain-containing protein n=1 Tax=Tetracentron sinense TaxID=13715 RepID=A0A835D6S6_TETSI|nr:hypothetical protein HHK36_024522 [Tetracentron sinense]
MYNAPHSPPRTGDKGEEYAIPLSYMISVQHSVLNRKLENLLCGQDKKEAELVGARDRTYATIVAMWMMGCSDGSGFNMSESFQGRKLRPLIPRPTTSNTTSTANTATAIPPCYSRVHGTELYSLNHHLATVTEQSRREFNTQPVVSSRWNPTPEQLRTLEELYRCGTRTPTAEQIQHITAQLRRFGKIEGKNVFYWFQNHKARERQKRRRQSESVSEEQQREIESSEKKESGSSRTGFEAEQTKNWVHPSTLAEESVSIQRAAREAVAETKTDGWIQFEEGELQQRRSLSERHATWQMMQLSSSSSPTNLINTTATTTAAAIRTIDPKLLNSHSLNIFITPNREYGRTDLAGFSDHGNNEEECPESQTLQLFPLRNDDSNGDNVSENETELPITMMNTNFTPNQFFEFLPLKN